MKEREGEQIKKNKLRGMQSLRLSHKKSYMKWYLSENLKMIIIYRRKKNYWMQLLLILYFGLFVYFKWCKKKNINSFCTLMKLWKKMKKYFKYRMNLIKRMKYLIIQMLLIWDEKKLLLDL